jgi:hypothetical protein
VLDAAAEQIWDTGRIEPEMKIEHFGDQFHVLIDISKKGPFRARILRVQH